MYSTQQKQMKQFQENSRKTSIIFGIEKTPYSSTNSSAKTYKPLLITKHKHRQKLWNDLKTGNIENNNNNDKTEKFDRSKLIKTSWKFGDEQNEWKTDSNENYIKYDKNNNCESQKISTSKLQKTHIHFGSNINHYKTTTNTSFLDIISKPIDQPQSVISKTQLQQTRIVFGDGQTRYWQKSTK